MKPQPLEFDGYELRRPIGKGGMGEVHLAYDRLLDRLVAVKFISAQHTGEVARKRFLIEARAVARLQHPNVVSIYRVGEVDGVPYLVSEFVRGKPLDTIPLPAPSSLVLKIAMDIANGLAAAHRQGVIHRDIKPANAIFTDDGEVKLLDFGIAKLLQPVTDLGAQEVPAGEAVAGAAVEGILPTVALGGGGERVDPHLDTVAAAAGAAQTQPTVQLGKHPRPDVNRHKTRPEVDGEAEIVLTLPGSTLGTPAYMAPEIWRGEAATFRSDVYSLGALLYTLCSGRPPHTADNTLWLSQLVVHEDARPLGEVASDVEPALCAIVDRCLKRDPELRFACGNEVRESLTQLTPAGRDKVLPEGNPYRGLYPFEAEHHNLFFGRDSEIRMILDRLSAEPFVLVAGDSGVGKSSLCRAGVVPCIDKWSVKERTWKAVTLLPGRSPVTSFSMAFAPLLDEDEEELARAIIEDPSDVSRRLRARHGDTGGVVIFIDQLEELVTISDAEEATAFAELLRWLVMPSPGVRVLGTVRGDFLSRLASLPQLTEDVSRALYFLRPLNEERIREAITGPSQAKGVTFDPPELVDGLVESTMRAGGGLPLLQFALAELWEARDRTRQTISGAALDAIGGVTGALTRHADKVLGRMAPRVRSAARNMLLRLVTAEGTRARMTEKDLNARDPHVQAAIAALVRGRLAVGRDTPEGPAYEIAHEALIHGWTTLAEWLSSDADARRVRDQLRRAVDEWERLDGARDMLWSVRQLREAEVLKRSGLTPRELGFLSASRRAHSRSKAIRWAVVIAIPVIAGLSYGGMWVKNKRDIRRRTEVKLAKAKAALAEARSLRKKAGGLRRRALLLFDRRIVKEAEKVWSGYLAAAAKVLPGYARASQELETALLLDRERADVRDLFADVLYERALLAEERHNKEEQDELLRRLSLYDLKGERRRKWNASGTLILTTEPLASSVAISRYHLDQRRKYRLKPIKKLNGPVSGMKLSPGSYLAVLKSPGRAMVRYPFLVRRGETLRIAVNLPRAADVPPGFVYVPPGRFLFGSAAADGLRRDFFHTVPLHHVTTKGYLIAKFETTFADWLEFLSALPPGRRKALYPRVSKGGFKGALAMKELSAGGWQISFQPTTKRYTGRSGEKIVYAGRSRRAAQDWTRLPVVGISAADAHKYVAWLKSSGRVKNARLCTEYEWERGARGSDGREYPHGESLEPDEANFDDTYGKNPPSMGPDEVGSHPASQSPFGLHDIAGNVWEWTRSSVTPKKHAARGGSWYFGANSSRTTDREVTEPSFRDASVGLRVCADLP